MVEIGAELPKLSQK